jgi:hypothetical protein
VAKRLVTEADVRALSEGGTLRLGGDVIATPSALDLAHERGIRIKWACGDETPGDPARALKACLWHRILETDGEFVVQVRGGRATVHQLGPAGPVPFGTDDRENHGS